MTLKACCLTLLVSIGISVVSNAAAFDVRSSSFIGAQANYLMGPTCLLMPSASMFAKGRV